MEKTARKERGEKGTVVVCCFGKKDLQRITRMLKLQERKNSSRASRFDTKRHGEGDGSRAGFSKERARAVRGLWGGRSEQIVVFSG